MDAVGGTDNKEDGDYGNEKVKDDSKREGEALHSGEGPGHGGGIGERGLLSYKFEGPPMGSPVMFPTASSSKLFQPG